MRLPLTTLAVVVALAATASVAQAAGGWRLQHSSATASCVPIPGDPQVIPRLVGALGISAPTTKPIAILDTGVDPASPNFAGRLLGGIDAMTGAPTSGDADGHGTLVAGFAAASGEMLGVSPTSPILPVRIFDAGGGSSAQALARGIALAVSHGAGVINISGAGARSDASASDILLVTRAIDAAFAKGVLVVSAAGNEGDGTQDVPATLPHVLVAGSATFAGARAIFSNTGPWVDVLTPGDGVTGPMPLAVCPDGYGLASGTSFSAPALAGAAALVSQLRPGLTTQQRFEVIRRGASDLGPAGRDDETGFGMLNVAAALSAKPPAKETQSEVDDDPYWVRGPFARSHPPFLGKHKRFKALGTVSPAKDPADVYPVKLTRGDRMVATLAATDPSSLLELSILSPRAGDFDITKGIDRHRLISDGGLTPGSTLEIRATRSGTYFIAVEAADAVDPSDGSYLAPATEAYHLSAYTQHKAAKRRAHH